MIIPVPQKICTDRQGISFLTYAFDALMGSPCGSELDVSANYWIDANLCSALGVIFEKLRKSGKLPGLRGRVNDGLLSMLRENHFFDIAICGKAGERPTISYEDFNRRFNFPYSNYGIEESKLFIKEYARGVISASRMPTMTEGVRLKMIDGMGELFNNAKVHSHSQSGVYACGQFNPWTRRMHFTIADAGIGFRNRLRESLGLEFSAEFAISWAMEYNHTTKNLLGGVGLKLLKDFIALNNGRLLIVSDAGYWEQSSDGVSYGALEHAFPGTLVSLDVNTADPQSYRLKNEAMN